jgi:NTP pyrophosphatase (non-canonical NTP hydrolase)
MRKLQQNMKVQDLTAYLFEVYGKRNNRYLLGRGNRIEFLTVAVGDLHEAIRKDVGPIKIGFALARIVARAVCVAHSFEKLDLSASMCCKYQPGKCSYCLQSPCNCLERRDILHAQHTISQDQYAWTLYTWQEYFRELYGQKNRISGIDNLVGRLFKEATELMILQLRLVNTDSILDNVDEEFAFEICDVVAWTLAIANYFDINLEEVIIKRYGKGCWKCHNIPCHCGPFVIDPVEWDKVV